MSGGEFTIRFSTDNAAFDDDAADEIARILATIAGKLPDGDSGGRILDVNGNTIGEWSWTLEDGETAGAGELDELEPYAIHTACRNCGHDIEGWSDSDDWRDRGGGTECLPYETYSTDMGGMVTVTPPADWRHAPSPGAE